jgi:hypothetical protein
MNMFKINMNLFILNLLNFLNNLRGRLFAVNENFIFNITTRNKYNIQIYIRY